MWKTVFEFYASYENRRYHMLSIKKHYSKNYLKNDSTILSSSGRYLEYYYFMTFASINPASFLLAT